MVAKTTEKLHDKARALDLRPLVDAARLMAEAQAAAAGVVAGAAPMISDAAGVLADTIAAGGCLYYTAAGSSGLMAAADAMELGGTFSIPAQQIRIHMAGGLPTGPDMPGNVEDDATALATAFPDDMQGDAVIAVSASGTTPYTMTAVDLAHDRGARVIGIANNPDTPLLTRADFPILLPTPPEVLSGSTRMGAGTAQKIALNMLSTLMALRLGHIHDGMMVNLRADNAKLRDRARGIVSEIAGVSADVAQAALDVARGDVKRAVLCARGASPDQAADLLSASTGHLRPALNALEQK